MTEVVFVARALTHYRVPFHEQVRRKLAAYGIKYRVLHGLPRANEVSRGDAGQLAWGEVIDNVYFGSNEKFVWQRIYGKLRSADLVIIGQENALLSNYPLQLSRHFGGARIAYFGHGRNFQSKTPGGLAERFKRYWIRRVDWWFAYTAASTVAIVGAGFDPDRITTFNNSIDTSQIKDDLASLDEAEQAHLRARLFIGSANVAVYVGGLYPLKRLDFLVASALEVRRHIPDFHLLVIGGGPDASIVQAAARENQWIHWVGPKFGREKAALVSLAKVQLIPGAVGLGIIDSFAYGVPLVTTAVPDHGPEIAYLENNQNGVMTPVGHLQAYSDAVALIMSDAVWRQHLQKGCASSVERYSIERMADRFAQGIRLALGDFDTRR